MKDFRSRKQKNLFLYSPIFLVVLFLLVILFVKSAYASLQKKIKAQKEEAKFSLEHQKLLDKKDELTRAIQKLSTEPGVIEELKEKFNVAQKGETIIRIVESRK